MRLRAPRACGTISRMATNVDIEKNSNENATNLIRRFSRAVQNSGTVKHLKSNRYLARTQSKYVRKSQALKRIAKREEVERLKKLGKM